MKKIIKNVLSIIVVIIFTIAIGSSCNSDDSSENYYFKAKFNNENFVGENVLAEVLVNDDVLAIVAIDGNNRTISMSISLQDYNGVGTYINDTVTFNFAIENNLNAPSCFWFTFGANDTGTMIITEDDDNHIKGTFQFTASPVEPNNCFDGTEIIVTEGEFNLKKVEINN
jgi:hypothetical protein